MPNDFYVTFMSNVSDPLYNDLNKTSYFWTKLSPAIKLDGAYEVALVDCIIKNTRYILGKDQKYDIKIRPHDWPPAVNEQHKIQKMNWLDYPYVELPYEELTCMNDLCRSINKRVSARKKRDFYFNYLKEEVMIYISSPIADEKVILIGNLKDIFGFKLNIINDKSAGNTYYTIYFSMLHLFKHPDLAIAMSLSYKLLNEKPIKIIFIITI